MKIFNKLLIIASLAGSLTGAIAAGNIGETNNRWVDVSLSNTSEFDITCQYRWYYEPDFGMNYATSATPTALAGTLWYPHPSDEKGYLLNWYLFASDKSTVYLVDDLGSKIRIDKMEKLCL